MQYLESQRIQRRASPPPQRGPSHRPGRKTEQCRCSAVEILRLMVVQQRTRAAPKRITHARIEKQTNAQGVSRLSPEAACQHVKCFDTLLAKRSETRTARKLHGSSYAKLCHLRQRHERRLNGMRGTRLLD